MDNLLFALLAVAFLVFAAWVVRNSLRRKSDITRKVGGSAGGGADDRESGPGGVRPE